MEKEIIADHEKLSSQVPSANEPESEFSQQSFSQRSFSQQSKVISPRIARLALAALTLICLLPFIGKPFNIDDPLFIWVAQRIVHHPLDPYGFPVVWYKTEMSMSGVTKNPPLASYYAAAFGAWTNWSEVALHLAFLLPALIVILATYELARDMTRHPVLAAVLTLATPAFLVSSSSVMSDVPMMALWMLCLLLWRKGLASEHKFYLLMGAILIALCALTKYFGACLIPLLLVDSLLRKKRVTAWAPFFLMPIFVLLGYQLWTKDLYGKGLLWDAAQYAQNTAAALSPSKLGNFLLGLSFTGGCALPVLTMAPLLFRKRWIAGALGLAVLPAVLIAWNVLGDLSRHEAKTPLLVTLVIFIAGGMLTMFLSATDWRKERTADSVLLALWVLGTFGFTALLNWTVNARSILPLIPAVAILIARALDRNEKDRRDKDRREKDGLEKDRPEKDGLKPALPAWVVAAPVFVSLAISLWLAASDTALAYSTREAAREVMQRHTPAQGHVFFTGHWGFQYYMQELGAKPVDLLKADIKGGDTIVSPQNNTNKIPFLPQFIASTESVEINENYGISPMNAKMNAAYYASVFGCLPFAFGHVPPEIYSINHLKP
jgi:4-amino-4-deoxy-L-arabinose transferase-like glycosyltransferase